jgi:hypothetical protein
MRCAGVAGSIAGSMCRQGIRHQLRLKLQIDGIRNSNETGDNGGLVHARGGGLTLEGSGPSLKET